MMRAHGVGRNPLPFKPKRKNGSGPLKRERPAWSANGDLPLPLSVHRIYLTAPWLTLGELASAFGYHVNTFYRLVSKGKLPCHYRGDAKRHKRRGDRIFFRDDALAFWNSYERWLIDDHKARRKRRYDSRLPD